MGSLLRKCSRLIFIDLRGASPLAENFFDRFGFDATFHQPGELRAFLRAHLRSGFRVLYQPAMDPPVSLADHAPGLAAHFDAVTQLVIATGQVIYAIDEIDRVCSAGWMPSGLSYLVNQGRHVQVSLVCSSRRPAQIARELTSQAHLFLLFKTTEPRDLKYLEEYLGSEAVGLLPRLPDYNFVQWEESEGIAIGDAAGRLEKKVPK